MNAFSPRADSTRGCFVGLLFVLFCAPLPLGSNRPWAWEPLALLIFLLAMLWLLACLRGRAQINPVLRAAWPMLACCALWLAWVWLQLLPLPVSLLEWLSPQAAHWHAAATFIGPAEAAPLSLDRQGGFNSALKSTAYVLFFVLTLLLLDSRERIRLAATTLIVSGLAQAMLGDLGALGALDGFGVERGIAHGTFVNRNHYAAYLVMCLSVGIGMLIANLSGTRSHTWKQFIREAAVWILSPKMRLRLALVVMVIALVLTRSRGGNSSFFTALLVAGAIGLILSRRATRSTVILLASLIAIDIFIVGAYFGVEQVVQRIETTTEESEDRDEVAGYAIAMWKDFPLFGSGLGSFAQVFPHYSGIGTPSSYTHAHNDYLQFLAETGVVGFALAGMMVLLSFIAALRAQYLREDPVMRGVSFAALMGIIALMMHSVVDFSLQIPANALTFMVLLAFAWLALFSGRLAYPHAESGNQDVDGLAESSPSEPSDSGKSRGRRAAVLRAGLIGVLLLPLGLLTFKTGQLALSDGYTLLAHLEYERGAGNPGKDAQWERSMAYLGEARRYAPDNAWPMAVTSDLRLRRMRSSTDRKQAYREAFTVQFDLRAYLRRNPTSPHAWSGLALAKLYAGDTGPEMLKALNHAQDLGPWEPGSNMTVLVVGLSRWPQLDAANQARLLGTMERAAQKNFDGVARLAQVLKRLDEFCAIAYVREKGAKACERPVK